MGHIDPFSFDNVYGALCHFFFSPTYHSKIRFELILENSGFFFQGVRFSTFDDFYGF
jgi:hypothetical protein